MPVANCLSFSSASRDETRDACLHHFIEPLPSLNAIDFVKRIFRKGGDVKILFRTSRSFGCGKHSRAALHRPCQQHLCWRLSNSCGDRQNDWIFEQPRAHSMTQWRESQKHNTFLLAEFQKLRFRQIRMGFDLDHGWLDSCRFVDGQQFVQADVRQSDGPAFALVHETFHCSPGIEQSHSFVVDDIAVLIPWVLLVPRLKCKRSVNEVEIQISEPESFQTRLEGRFDALGPMIGVPQLCGNENVFARDPPAASPACNASPTSRSFRYRSAQSKCRNPAASASLVVVMVSAGSGIRVPQPSAGIWPLPLLSAILVSRRSEDPVMGTPLRYFASCITTRNCFSYFDCLMIEY